MKKSEYLIEILLNGIIDCKCLLTVGSNDEWELEPISDDFGYYELIKEIVDTREYVIDIKDDYTQVKEFVRTPEHMIQLLNNDLFEARLFKIKG